MKNVACGTFFQYLFCLNRDAFDLKFLVLSSLSLSLSHSLSLSFILSYSLSLSLSVSLAVSLMHTHILALSYTHTRRYSKMVRSSSLVYQFIGGENDFNFNTE